MKLELDMLLGTGRYVMSKAWPARRKQIDDTLPELHDALKDDLRGCNAAQAKLANTFRDDNGTLLDLIELLPPNCKRTSVSTDARNIYCSN